MIGRFAELGVYRELARSGEMYRIAFGGLLGLAGYLWNETSAAEATLGQGLILASLAINGFPIVWGAVRGLLHRKVNVDELVSLAIIGSLLQGELLTAVVVSFVMVLGSLVEQVTTGAAHKAIRSLINIHPETATVLVDGKELTVSVYQVNVGDILLVKPGDRIPVDGIVKKGATAVDESPMTGEPIPQEKTAGSTVFAGTLNQTGVIEIEAKSVGEDTTLGKVIKLVSRAEYYKPRSVRLIDRYATWFTPTILLCAGVAWWLTGDVGRAVTVLIVGCPCALILAAPTAVVAAIGRAAKAGILVKGGQFLEEAGRANVILFDKTGTLTRGEPRINTIVSVDGSNMMEVLACAASVEQNSTHPLARAVLKAAHYAKVTLSKAEDMVAEIGFGVRACVNGRIVEVGSASIGGGAMQLPLQLRQQVETFKENGMTPLVVYEDQRALGVMAVTDPIRAAAQQTVCTLKGLKIECVAMVSGDHEKSARRVADEVGLTDAWSDQKPQDKLQVIRDFQDAGKTVIFVGDGINDAPALATANVGVAMGAAGTDVALETADVALMNDDISKIPFLIDLGRRTLLTIKWNLAFGLLFNAAAVLAGGWGILSPIMGAIVHNIGSVLVVLSSARLAFIAERKA
ncbi:MAG: heavy metal translocating P-type ATPase [Thermodesulfobacteriota bacterium]